jgi:hypothetical protein
MFLIDESSVIDLAKQAIEQPEDSWFGNDNLWHTHGMSGFSCHRDSGLIERSNFDVMVEILSEEFGEQDVDGDWWVNHASHWAVGWVNQIMVRIIIDPNLDDPFIYTNITDIFKFCMEHINNIHDYAILDDQHYHDLVDREFVNEISFHMPNWASNSFDASSIARFAYENDVLVNESDDGCWMISPFFVEVATFILGMYDDNSLEEMNRDLQVAVEAKSFGYDDSTCVAQTLFAEFLSLMEI